MSFRPTTFEEAREKAKACPPRQRTAMKRGSGLKSRSRMKPGTKRLRAKPDPKMKEWRRQVLERDGGKCQWPGLDYADVLSMPVNTIVRTQLVISPCVTGDKRIDPHHIAERSLRPDLKYDVSNGIALCRTHHEWLPLNRALAVKIGLLSEKTYERAMKEKSMKERCYTIDDGSGENPGVLSRQNVLDHVATILDDDFILSDGQGLSITIRRNDMTRAEIDALPEV